MSTVPRDTAPALIAQLQRGPRTKNQLCEDLDCSRATVTRWLSAFEAAGAIVGEMVRGDDGNSRKFWRMNMREGV